MTGRSRSRYVRFAAHLLRVLGSSVPISLAACGGADGASNAEDVCPGESPPAAAGLQAGAGQRVRVCVNPLENRCAKLDDPGLRDAMNAELGESGVTECACDCYAAVRTMSCGPKMSAETSECCYDVEVDVYEQCGKGRDFIVDGNLRTAGLSNRHDWLASDVAPMGDLSPDDRRALAEAWSRDALLEHASVAAFGRFGLELLAVGAPAHLVSAAQLGAAQEVRHAELCFALASTYAGHHLGPDALEIGGAIEVRSRLSDVAASAVLDGCIGETIAAFRIMAARDRASDEAVRKTLAEIGRDEAKHAELSWKFVAWAVEHGDSGVRAAVFEALSRGEATARATERALSAKDAKESAALAAYGRLSAADELEVRRHVWREVIRPCFAALLATLSPGGASARAAQPAR